MSADGGADLEAIRERVERNRYNLQLGKGYIDMDDCARLLALVDAQRVELDFLRQTLEDIYSDRRENPHGF